MIIKFFFLNLVGATVDGTSQSDACDQYARQLFGKSSFCDSKTQECESLHWDTPKKENVVYFIANGDSAPGINVTCDEASVSLSTRGRKRKTESPHRVLELTEVTLREVLSRISGLLSSVLNPAVLRWPLVPFSSSEEEAASRITGYIETLTNFVDFDEDEVKNILKSFVDNDQAWQLWKFALGSWLQDLDFVRFDQGSLLETLYPYLRIHLRMVNSLFVREAGERKKLRFRFPLIQELDTMQLNLSGMYSPWNKDVTLGRLLKIFYKVRQRLAAVWRNLSERRVLPAGEGVRSVDSETLDSFEQVAYEVLMHKAADGRKFTTFTEFSCPKIVELTGYISWVWFFEPRRAHRLLASLLEPCKAITDTETRRRVIEYLPSVFLHLSYFSPRTLSLSSSNKDVVVRESLPLLKNIAFKLDHEIKIRFKDSAAEGDAGPRAHWLQCLFDYFFRTDNGIFQYADDRKLFIKPGKNTSQQLLLAAGRLIGLGVKYGLSIGARLNPCGLEMLRFADSKSSDDCVEAEDPEFLRQLNSLGQEIESMNDEEAGKFLKAVLGEDISKSGFQDYKGKEVHKVKIAPIRMSYLLIKQGINTVIPSGSLGLFTKTEVEKMIHGKVQLTAHDLWNGIRLIPPRTAISGWLNKIIHEETDEFRFAFNRFATGVNQPPVHADEPWITFKIDTTIQPDQLPKAETCFGIIRVPEYPSRDILKQKLSIAVSDGNGYMDLY